MNIVRVRLMELLSETSIVVLIASFILVLLLSWKIINNKPHLNLPPSPKSLPIIGHLHHLAALPDHPHITLMELSKRYGPLMYLQLGATPSIVVSSPKIAKEVLQTNGSVFASRPKLVSAKEVMYSFKSIGSSVYGQHWKDMRRMCTSELFTSRRLATFTTFLEEELTEILGHDILPAAINGQLVHVRKLSRAVSFNTITRILMSKTFFGSKVEQNGAEEAREFVQHLDDIMQALLQMSVGDVFPQLAWLDNLWKLPRMRNLHGKIDKFLQKTVVEHRVNGNTAGDFIDVLDSHFGVENEDYIKATILDLIIGGTDTSSTHVEWALAEVLNHPEVMAKVQKELESVVGMERLVRTSDIPKLEYLNAVIRETFRLHPPIQLLGRASTCAVQVDGYDVPQDSIVFVNFYAIGRDSEAWKDAEVFDPERFIGSSINVFGQDFELIPFGAGRRVCPGLQLGLRNVHLTLANLLHGFNWKLPEGKAQHYMAEKFGLTTVLADPLMAKVSPRLIEKLYFQV